MRYLILCSILLSILSADAQQTIYDTIAHQNIDRSYILYVPATYDPNSPAPLVLNFHGYTSDAGQQMFYGDFRPVADTAGFILVHPQGTKDNLGNNYWNSGWGGTVNDVSFTEALIDSLSAEYNINPDRVYSTGMSNGGFMSYHLACNLSNRIAAIASVTGSMNEGQLSCNTSHPMPVMQIHGTSDPTVPYLGLAGSFQPIEDVVDYWVSFNSCDINPTITAVSNSSLLDLCTAEHIVYKNGNKGVEVEFYKVTNGAHTWPGSAITIGTTNQDFNASKEIWRFFSAYDINGRIWPTHIKESQIKELSVFPNPSSNELRFEAINELVDYQIINQLGQVVNAGKSSGIINIQKLEKGQYILAIDHSKGLEISTFIKK
jgi:polyhydroxybutyrate depolymerase